MRILFTRLLGSLYFLGGGAAACLHAQSTDWVKPGPEGKLVYQSTVTGDRIMDFSFAGYHAGGVPLPEVPVEVTVATSQGEDDTARIQGALDAAGRLHMVAGHRGTVLLAPGVFHCSQSLEIKTSGVVLRGAGSGNGPGGTVIYMSGAKHVAVNVAAPAIQVGATSGAVPGTGRAWAKTQLADKYAPSGTNRIHVASAAGFAVGDYIVLEHPVTKAWVAATHMDDLQRDGKKQTWLAVGHSLPMVRHIAALNGDEMSLEPGLADAFDANLFGPTGTPVQTYVPKNRLQEVGIEHLRIACAPTEVSYSDALYSAIRLESDDSWIRDVACDQTMSATTLLGTRITVDFVRVIHQFPNLGASKPSDFSIEGSQILINRCEVLGDNEYPVWTSSMHAGPNVVLNSTFRGRGSYIQPHHRWSTGLLVDNCTVPDGGIDYMNRGVGGSGHGWAMGWGVVWNCVAGRYIIQNPPGVANWAIGNMGERVRFPRFFDSGPEMPEGNFASHGIPVAPQSLYLAQLADRLGPRALAAIGYQKNTLDEFPNKTVSKLPPWPEDIDPVLGHNFASHRPVDTSAVRGGTRQFGGERALDGDARTYWATPTNAKDARFEVDTEGPVDINAIVLEEASGEAGRVQEFKVEGQVNSDWQLLGSGRAIGAHLVLRFPVTRVWKVRLTIVSAAPYGTLRRMGLYRAN